VAAARRGQDDPGAELVRVDDPENPTDGDDEDEDEPSGWFAELRFLFEGATGWDAILFATEAALSTPSEGRTKGKWRKANIAYAYLVCRPSLVVVYLLVWAFLMRLDRAMKSFGVVVALAVVGNRIPVVEFLVFWDWADPTTWAWVRRVFAVFSPDPAPAAPPAGAVD
jgi:hypothetical protein